MRNMNRYLEYLTKYLQVQYIKANKQNLGQQSEQQMPPKPTKRIHWVAGEPHLCRAIIIMFNEIIKCVCVRVQCTHIPYYLLPIPLLFHIHTLLKP